MAKVAIDARRSFRSAPPLRFSALGKIHYALRALPAGAVTVYLRGNLHRVQVCHYGSN